MTANNANTVFARALLNPELPTPMGITAYSGAPNRRFDVYRNNVIASLVNALRTRFPAVERIVGDAFFAGAARLYVGTNPPRSRLMMRYGDEFPDFLADFKPAAELPYLPDVARIEAARTRAYHSADAAGMHVADITALDPEFLLSAQVTLHPSLEIVSSAHPALTIWAMNADEAELGPVDFDRAEDALIARPQETVTVRALPDGGADFLLMLRHGVPLGHAADTAASRHRAFDLAANLAGLIGAGLIVDLCPTSRN